MILLAVITAVKSQRNPCQGVWFGNVAHPSICYKYYSCTLQLPKERSCPSDEIFDNESLKCVPGNQVTCEPYQNVTNHPTTSTGSIMNTTYDFTTTQGKKTKKLSRNTSLWA